jgi:hypothetical protein
MKPAQYRAARDALGWTHAKLAETIGVSERTPIPLRRRRGGSTGARSALAAAPGPAAPHCERP